MNQYPQNGSVKTLSRQKCDPNAAEQLPSNTAPFPESSCSDADIIDIDVVLLINYIRRHHMVAFQELQKRVRKLTVLLSVPMEPDREWEADWGGLDVVLQKNRMFTSQWKHSAGFSEKNYIHVPTDTTAQLKRLQPDVILSYEMGMRTLLCSAYRLFHRSCRLVMVGNMSQHVEAERGFLRRTFRKIIKRGCDFFTYNGPSCRRYLQSIDISDDKLFHLPYCIDQETVYRGQRSTPHPTIRKMIYCGSLSSRKGVHEFATAARNWCAANREQTIQLRIAGGGELQQEISALGGENFQIEFLGNCDLAGLRDAYKNADLCVFPSLADEWGLVPIEAMASGLPVLGSFYAQSVEAHVQEGKTGWVFRPDNEAQIEAAIERAMQVPPDKLLKMGQAAQTSVAGITPAASADHVIKMIRRIAPQVTP
jgi:glycosyltransferase involved in cell wall biosynthesis